MKKTIAIVIAAVMLALCGSCSGGCSSDGNKNELPKEVYNPPEIEAQTYSEEYHAYPRAKGVTQKTIDVLELTGCDWYTLFAGLAIQGIANRENPAIYLIRSGNVVQDDGEAARYWLENLSVAYGEGVFTINNIPSIGDLLVKYRDCFDGAILYPDRLLVKGTQLVNQSAASTIYGDMALINYTTMYCAQKNAIPVTQSLLEEFNSYLEENGKEKLSVIADTSEMLVMEDGSTADSSSRALWKKVYTDALAKHESGEWEFSDEALGHNGTWNACWYDYIFANKLFTYNRITEVSATQEESDIEDAIMGVTKNDTPMMGVWHLVADLDEASLVSYCDDMDKFFLVSFGTWDMSWSSGLEHVKAEEKSGDIVYDPSKTYISFCLSETDNNTYTYYYMRNIYESEYRGEFAMTWQINQAMYDLNPNIIAYLNNTFADTDSYAFGEAGIGYIRNLDQRSSYDFISLSDSYYKKTGVNGGINTMYPGIDGALKYVEYGENIPSVTVGYLANENSKYVEYGMNYYFRDTPIFVNLGTEKSSAVLDYNLTTGSLLNVRLAGFGADLGEIKATIDKLPENVVVVNQTQLISLYKQKMEKTNKNVNQVEFDCNMNETESAFLWYSDDYMRYNKAAVENEEEYRYGERQEQVIYRFRFDSSAKKAVFDIKASGEYKIQLSTDYKNWTTVAQYDITREDQNYSDARPVSFEVPEEMVGKTVYMRISDPTPDDAVGYRIYSIAASTDVSALEKETVIENGYDKRYLVSETAENGITEKVYRIPVKKDFRMAAVSVESFGNAELSMGVSSSKFYPLDVTKTDRSDIGEANYFTSQIDSIGENVYIKIKSDGEFKRLRFVPVEDVSSFGFSPCGSEYDLRHCLTGDKISRNVSGASSNVKIGVGDYLTYAFRIEGTSASPLLEILGSGMLKIEVSENGKTWNVLRSVSAGENISGTMKFDASSYVKPGKMFYLRFSKSVNVGADPAVYYISLK